MLLGDLPGGGGSSVSSELFCPFWRGCPSLISSMGGGPPGGWSPLIFGHPIFFSLYQKVERLSFINQWHRYGGGPLRGLEPPYFWPPKSFTKWFKVCFVLEIELCVLEKLDPPSKTSFYATFLAYDC